MKREIFILKSDNKLEELVEEPYSSEDLLQSLLESYPSLLSGPQIDPDDPRRWLLVKREARLPMDDSSGRSLFLDHLLLDQDSIPTLVEVKRSTDTRIRREVVGQMLDYAANAVAYLPVESLMAQFEQQCAGVGNSPDDVLAEFLGEEGDPGVFWERVKTNLQAGRIRMLFVADEIPSELRSIVEFLNQQMDPAIVLAIEIKQYAGGDLKTLVPVVLGQTSEAQQRKGSVRTGKQWDEVSWFEKCSQSHSEEELKSARILLEWARKKGLGVWWGRGKVDGSFVPVFEHQGKSFSLFAAYTYGSVEVCFQYMKSWEPFQDTALRLELLRRINLAPGIEFPKSSIELRPRFSLKQLVEPEVMSAFLEAYDWVVTEFKKCYEAGSN